MTRQDRVYAFLGIKSPKDKLKDKLKSEIQELNDRIEETTEALKQGYGSPSEDAEWRRDNKIDKLKLKYLENSLTNLK